MQLEPDSFGKTLLDYLETGEAFSTIERDDGYINVMNAEVYFAPFADWPERQQQAMQFIKGRVLDVGAGAGRHALYVQEQGHDVIAIDVSPMAIEVCRKRGVKDARLLSIADVADVDESIGQLDTMLILGNNFGVLGNPADAKRLLKRFHDLMPADGRIIAETLNPYGTENPVHLAYHERNRQQGRMSGQVKIRTRYLQYADDWFDYLFVSPDEMREILRETGWEISQILGDENGIYIAILNKAP